MRIAYFTAGTVGAGHLVRGLAIRRGLERAGFRGSYRMFGPGIPIPLIERVPYELVDIAAEELRERETASASGLARSLAAWAPDLLLIDLFWAPLHHIVGELDCPAWLLVRKCPDQWFVGPSFFRFDAARYEHIIATEPLDHWIITDMIDPVVICNRNEREPKNALRELLEVPRGETLTVVAHAGNPGEIETVDVPRRDGETVVTASLHRDELPFPLAAWLHGADRIVAAGGYNTFWEARTLGYFERTEWVTFERVIDNQKWRLATCSEWTPEGNGADQLAAWMLEG
jgi:hypothetical protein